MFLKNMIIGASLLSIAQASVRQNNPYDATFMGDTLARHNNVMEYQHQPYSPVKFKIRQNDPYGVTVFIRTDESIDDKSLKNSESSETLEGSVQTYAGISPSESSRSASIQTGNSPIQDVPPPYEEALITLPPAYEESLTDFLPAYEEALTTLPPPYFVRNIELN